MSQPTNPPPPPITLDLDNIQGDVLKGLVKRAQSILFFEITNATLFQELLQTIIPWITTTAQVEADEAAIAAHKAAGGHGLLKIVGTNLGFSQTGLNVLGITESLNDTFFANGQLVDASNSFANGGISDPGVPIPNTDRVDPNWEPAFKQVIHGCFLITGESNFTVVERLGELYCIFRDALNVVQIVDGHVRPGKEAGHEHFGFLDGLSNPPVIGFRPPNKGEVPTQPGVILLGEPGDAVTRPSWAKDSSFLVFRKLQQFVPEFNDFLTKNAIKDPGLTPAQGSELLGARMVGRWKSGAPIDRDPTADNLADANNPNKVNDFDYSDDLTAGVRCPFTAHLRKMNPRNSKVPGLSGVQVRRIIRQGIPYGPEVTPQEAFTNTTIFDRGLLFVCYQSTVQLGFHFLQQLWANNPNFPSANEGFDPIIGQNVNDPRSTLGLDPDKLTASLALPQPFVAPRGGEYFLSPSIAALKTRFAVQPASTAALVHEEF